jgi:hypothetical protein
MPWPISMEPMRSFKTDIVRVEGDGYYGILCRRFLHDGRDDYYMFAIGDGGQVAIFKSQEFKELSPWRQLYGLKQTNHVVAQCQKLAGSRYDQVQLGLWINDTLVASAIDDTPLLRGTIALFAEGFSGQTFLASFDNLAIER